MWNFPNRNFGLDVIRAIAILLVIASHCTYILPEFSSTLTDGIRLLGATGVDIFFVLSGYLVGGILLKRIKAGKTTFKDLSHFWKRRWLRTLPNYFVIFFSNIILLLFLNETLVDDIWLYLVFIQNFLSPHPNFFTEAWSLSIEEYAYLILPALIYIAIGIFKKRNNIKTFFKVTAVLIVFLFCFKILFYFNSNIETYKDWSGSFRKVVLYRLDAIYYGFILVYLYKEYSFLKRYRNLLVIISFSNFVILHALIVYFKVFPQNYLLFYTLGYLPLISISIALAFPWFQNLKANKITNTIIRYISLRSYAIYLVNYSLILLSLKSHFSPSPYLAFLFLLITAILSELLFRLIEQPFLRYRDKVLPK